MKLIHFQLPPKFIALDGVVDANVVLEADEALINSNLLTPLTATFKFIPCQLELNYIEVPHRVAQTIQWEKWENLDVFQTGWNLVFSAGTHYVGL